MAFKIDPKNIGEKYIPNDIVSGSPYATVANQYTDASKTVSAGVWTSTVGKWGPWKQEVEEFCYIISGKAVLHSKDGTKQVFTKGDCFVIPVGFEGHWETLEDLAKYYCAAEPPKSKL
eukprot:Phypoly_transcript_27554.p1 GENE.Phypoly_transcript_27554~~Phypoly_transcript_27554.p1  ORF type:complete len:118 (+),score=21.92 Phypoly_transcript_27554:87-440(+)